MGIQQSKHESRATSALFAVDLPLDQTQLDEAKNENEKRISVLEDECVKIMADFEIILLFEGNITTKIFDRFVKSAEGQKKFIRCTKIIIGMGYIRSTSKNRENKSKCKLQGYVVFGNFWYIITSNNDVYLCKAEQIEDLGILIEVPRVTIAE